MPSAYYISNCAWLCGISSIEIKIHTLRAVLIAGAQKPGNGSHCVVNVAHAPLSARNSSCLKVARELVRAQLVEKYRD